MSSAVDPSILELFAQTCYRGRYQGRTVGGDPIHDDPQAFACRMDPVYRTVLNADGEEEQSAWELITAQELTVSDKVWVSADTDDELAHRVKQVEPIIDETGAVLIYQVLI